MEQIAKDFRRGTFTRTVPVKGHPEKTTTEEVPVKVVNAGKLFGRLTLDVFGKALSSIDFDAIHNPENAKVEQYYRVLWNMFHPLYNLFPMLESLGVRSKVRQATYAIIDSFIEIVKKRREEIMAAQYVKEDEANHKGYSHEEIRNELWGFNLAAIDTTAKALTSCTYLLAIHPEIQEKVRDEVLQVLGDEPHDVYPTVGELKNMPFLEAVLKETLRLYSPVYKLITRRTTEDVPLPDDGIIIPRNTKIGFHFHGIHMLNEVWPEATSYKPERWLDRKEVAGEFMPFGHGARRCPGEPMSMLEQKVTMAMMLRRFTWELPADHQGAGMTRIGLVTVADQRVMFKPRHLD
ncbi:cytochrome P450 [Ramicandelaber brevisporus]|nr:cytochrome P450 [Ramicandelaber brevisporus]